MPTTFQFRTFLTYWLDAVTEHSLHSPFFYDLYTNVIRVPYAPAAYSTIEQLRHELLSDTSTLSITDLGAGSQTLRSNTRRVCDIARISLTPADLSALYARIIAYFNCTTVLELGTSLGINTLYLAARAGTQVTTFEGSPEIAAQARASFNAAGADNITLVQGNIDQTLPTYLTQAGKIDLAFIDANHRYEPTVRYFQWLIARIHTRSVLIFDDIHYSREMQQAWEELRHHTLVYASADLYRCGLLFFDPSLNKQHVVLQR